MPKLGRRSEIPPLETQIGGPLDPNLINKVAPFGTLYTPTFRTKIIGGKPQYVQERFQRVQPLYPPRTIDEAVGPDPENGTTPRNTDWSMKSVVPPITSPRRGQTGVRRQHESRPVNFYNSYSELENPSSILSAPSAVADQSQNHPQSILRRDHEQQTSATISQPKLPPQTFRKNELPQEISRHDINLEISTAPASKATKVEPAGYSPRDYSDYTPTKPDPKWMPIAGYSYLPTHPVFLNKDEEKFLLHKLSMDLIGCTSEQLRQVYSEMTKVDKQLTGWGPYSEFTLAMEKNGVYTNLNSLRLAASTCVATEKPGVVDYEKLLSLLIVAVKSSEPQTEKYYVDQKETRSATIPDLRSKEYEYTGSEGKLLRMIQQSIMASENPLDVESLRNAFSQADRSHRLTLSHGEIKEICYRERVPLQESIINNILANCQTHGDGQYQWSDFLSVLERVQPENTGLNLPRSKRPLEYAKRYLQPKSSWPHPAPTKSQNAVHESKAPEIQEQVTPQNQSFTQKQVSAPANLGSFHNPHDIAESSSYQSPRGQFKSPPHPEKPWRDDHQDEWFAGFKKMAQALYRNDLEKMGSIKPEHSHWMLSEYNEIHNLNFSEELIKASIDRNTTTSGTEIDGLLQTLLNAANF